MERIFERTWVFVGHESEVAAGGDYKTITIGFAMLADDAIYWVSCNGEGIDWNREISLVYDDHARLRDRIDRSTAVSRMLSVHRRGPAG